MATQTHSAAARLTSDEVTVATITYRGPSVLLGAFAHLLREAGLEFDRPSDDRRVTAAAVGAVLTVRAAVTAADRSVEDMVAAAVTRFTTRFGEDSASIRVGLDDSAD